MISYNDLLGYLKKLDKILEWKIKLVAVGGTALVLERLKASTKDIDFCVETKKDYGMLIKAIKKIEDSFKIDLWHDGYIFTLQLPEDYIARSKTVKTGLKSITLKILSPSDIILTKVSRLNQRDIEDIESVIKNKKIDKKRLIGRFNIVKKSYAGSEKVYEENFKSILKWFFN